MGTLLATRKVAATGGLLPGEYALHSVATSGIGTNDSKWDVTAGWKNILAQMGSKGGSILVGTGAYTITETIRMGLGASQELIGRGRAGFPKAPNASNPPESGICFFPPNGVTMIEWGIGGSADNLRPGNVGMSNIGVYGANRTNPNNVANKISGCEDQGKWERNSYANLWAAWFFNDARGGANFDTCRITKENVLYCKYGIYIVGALLNPFSDVSETCISDCENEGIYIVNTNPSNASGTGRSWVFDRLTMARCNFLGGNYAAKVIANKTRVVNCTVEDSGYDLLVNAYNPNGHGWYLGGDDPQVSGGTFSGHKTGTAITFGPGYGGSLNTVNFGGGPGDDGQNGNSNVQGASTNLLDIMVESGRYDLSITQPGKYSIVDYGTRTRQNGWGTNNGDPNSEGDWAGVAKPEYFFIHDKISGKIWLYSSKFVGGRFQMGVIAAAAGATTPATGADQITWFATNSANGRNVNCNSSLASNGVVTLTKILGNNGDTTCGAVSKKAISSAPDPTIPAFTLSVNNTGINDNYARYIGLVSFANIGTAPNGERALEMPYRLYYDFGKFLVAIAQTNQPAHNQVGSIQLVGYAENNPNVISRLDLVFNGTPIESYPNLAIALPLAIDTRLDITDAYIKGAALTAQTLIDTPS
jgi:hypothetical protein